MTAAHPNPAPDRSILRIIGKTLWLIVLTLFWAAAAAIIIGVGAAIFSIDFIGPFILYIAAFLALLLMAWSSAQSAVRRRRMLLIINTLSSAARLEMPLVRLLHDSAISETGIMQKRLFAIERRLERGESLEHTLFKSAPEIPLGVIRAIGAAERNGCLSPVLDSIIRRAAEKDALGPTGPRFYWAYPAMIFTVISLIMIVVIPKYEGIFRDFRIELPWPTIFLIAAARNLSLIWLLLVIVTFIPLGRALASLFPIARQILPFGGEVRDRVVWLTPILGTYAESSDMARLCDFLTIAADLHRPLDDSLREAAAAQSNAVMRRKATRWAQLIAKGQSMNEAAREAKLPDLFASLLATVRTGDSFENVLRFLRQYYEYRLERIRAFVNAFCMPAIVLILGACVALVGASLMSPIAALINTLASTPPYRGF